MAAIPISTFFELLFAFFAIYFYKGSISLERLAATGFLVLEIPLITLPQEFYFESSGIVTSTTVAFTSSIIGYVVLGVIILTFVALYRWWDLYTLERQEKKK